MVVLIRELKEEGGVIMADNYAYSEKRNKGKNKKKEKKRHPYKIGGKRRTQLKQK